MTTDCGRFRITAADFGTCRICGNESIAARSTTTYRTWQVMISLPTGPQTRVTDLGDAQAKNL